MSKSLGGSRFLREEEIGAIKTLKRLDHMNPSVGINGMNDYQATYNKRW